MGPYSRKDTHWAEIVEAPKLYGEVVGLWDQNPFGQNLSPARQLAVNNVQKVRVSPAQLLTGHKAWATLDYSSIQNPDFQGNLEWTVERAGTGQGIVVWFDAGTRRRHRLFQCSRRTRDRLRIFLRSLDATCSFETRANRVCQPRGETAGK